MSKDSSDRPANAMQTRFPQNPIMQRQPGGFRKKASFGKPAAKQLAFLSALMPPGQASAEATAAWLLSAYTSGNRHPPWSRLPR